MDHMQKLLGMATLNEKGQVVIPAEARAFVDLHPGDKLLVISGPHKSGLMLMKPKSLEMAAEKLSEHITNLQDVIKQGKDQTDE